jgi:pimeloyl-ACP methyl ester carboxylesterase
VAPDHADPCGGHTVVVPDLRGAGGAAKPASGYDKKTMAVDIHELARLLGFDHIRIVGHDIGLMVAYALRRGGSGIKESRSRHWASVRSRRQEDISKRVSL